MDDETTRFLRMASYFGGGALSGFLGALGVRKLQQRHRSLIEKKGKIESKDVASLLFSFSAFLPESKWKYVLSGAYAGMSVENILSKHWKDTNLRPMTAGDLREMSLIARWSKFIHFDESLPIREKEKIVAPLFASTVTEQMENPLQQEAIAEYQEETGTSKMKWTIQDSFWFQQWILYWFTYTPREGLWRGHDRFRTLSKLMRGRRLCKIRKRGHCSYYFDCDDGTLSHNQLVASYGYDHYAMLISQRPLYQGTHPLHHVLPVVSVGRTMWAVETIKNYPIIPITEVGRIFQSLQRVVIVAPDGQFAEYEGWRR